MTLLVPVSDLRFPYADSSRYLGSQDSSLFQSFFFIPAHFDRLTNSACYFIIGDKGTGKTAVATYISSNFHSSMSGMTIEVEKSDFDNFFTLSNSLPKRLTFADYVEIWETLLSVLSFVRAYSIGTPSEDALPSELFATVEKLSSGSAFDRLSDIFDVVLWNRPVLYSSLASSPSLRARVSGPMPDHLRSYLRLVRNLFVEGLRTLHIPSTAYAVFIDRIDTRPVSDISARGSIPNDDHITCVSALVEAIWNLNTKMLNRIFGIKFRIVLLVRPDILERVNIQNSSLLIRDNSLFLNWYARNNAYQTSAIYQLADNILVKQQHDPALFSRTGEAWERYFPDMIKTYGDRERDSFVGLLNNSFYRPRDVITVYGTLQEYMVTIGEGHSRQFNINMIKQHEVRQRYSEYLLGEVKDSTLFYYDLKDYDLFLKFFEFLAERLRGFEFTYEDFTTSFNALRAYFEVNNIEPASIYETADNFLQFLYELNIVGFFGPGGQKGILHFCVANRSYPNIRPKVKSGTNYRLHYGVARALYPARIS